MKNFFGKIIVLLILVFAALTIVGCDDQPDDEKSPATETPITYEYKLNKTSLTLEEGQTDQLSVIVNPSKEINATYESLNAEVASVSASGLVTALSSGSSTIKVKVDGEELTCEVTVTAKEVEYEYTLNFSTITLEVESTKKIMVFVDPDKDVTPVFESLDSSVASVSADGLVTALKEGSTKIKVKVDGHELECNVIVNPKPIEYQYSISAESLDLVVGALGQLSINVTPDKAIVPTWVSSNESVLSIAADGSYQALAVGSATVTATVDGNTFICEVNVTSLVTVNSVLVEDGNGMTVNLTDVDSELDTLYWEHYQEGALDAKINAEDLIIANSATASTRFFWDYKAKLQWNDGTINGAWDANYNGICPSEEISITINVNPSVKQIRLYTGAWRATGNATLIYNDVVLARSESWIAEESGIATFVTFDITVTEETAVTIKITPSNQGENGNTSITAVAILGVAKDQPTTSLLMNKTEMTSYNDWHIDLSLRGNIDWYYVNGKEQGSDKAPDEKLDGNAIDVTHLKGNGFWDYKAAFTWSDGTYVTSNPTDDDVPFGINNGKCAGYMRVDVNIDANTKHVYLYVGGYQSAYCVQVIDSKGNAIYSELLSEATDGTVAFELDFLVNATENDKLTFIIYKSSGNNVSLTAVAVSDKDIEYKYTINPTEMKMNIGEVRQLSVKAEPHRLFNVSYSSSNEAVCTVDENGKVTATGLGSAVVTALIDGAKVECAVNVVEVEYSYTINYEQAELLVTGTLSLNVVSQPAKDDIYVVWSSSDDHIVSVDSEGNLKALKAGTATIVGVVGNKEVACEVTVKPIGTEEVSLNAISLENVNGSSVDLTGMDNVLYWEHYQEDFYGKSGIASKAGTQDLIISNNVASGHNFGDYKVKFNWHGAANLNKWINNTMGKWLPEDIKMTIKVNPSVKQIQIYTGAWNATAEVVLVVDGNVVAKTNPFNAEGDGMAYLATLDLNVAVEKEIEIQINYIASNGGNINNPAVIILGDAEANAPATTTVTMTKYEMTGNEKLVDLTVKGNLDWYYPNYENNPDEMLDGSYILSNTMSGSGSFWDYKGTFKWSNGTVHADSPSDPNEGHGYTNNGKSTDHFVSIDVKVDASVKHIYVYATGWDSKYGLLVLDRNGNIILDEMVAEKVGGQSVAYECNLNVETLSEDVLTIVVYKIEGSNCGLAAVAVSSKETSYQIDKTQIELNVEGTSKINPIVYPTRTYSISYVSSDSSIVSVDQEGNLVALGVGNANIIVTIDGRELICHVEVKEKEIEYQYQLNHTELNLDFGQTSTLIVSVNPDKPLDISWESSNESIVKVDELGKISVVGAGSAVITAHVDGLELKCNVVATVSVSVDSVLVEDGNEKNVNVSEIDNLLYWEHYQVKNNHYGRYPAGGTAYMKGVEDLIISNSIESVTRGFSDYRTKFTWINAGRIAAFTNNPNGLCHDGEIVIRVKVNSNVKQIIIYTGGWRATGTASMYLNGVKIAESDSWVAGNTGIATHVKFNLTVTQEVEVEIKLTPSELGDAGNISNPAVFILGTKPAQSAPTTQITMTRTELTNYNEHSINLTEKGTRGWYYLNYDHQHDYSDPSTNSVKLDSFQATIGGEGYLTGWDFRAAFKWTNGTNFVNSPIDNDCNNAGTNNGIGGDVANIDVNVDENTSNIYFYVSGWNTTYYVCITDSHGNVLLNELMHERVDGQTFAYECNFAINASMADTLTVSVYKVIPDGNCVMAAIAVS